MAMYMCPKCEMAYGEPKMHPDCNDPECGTELSETESPPTPEFTIDVDPNCSIDGTCDYNNCPDTSTHIWFGFVKSGIGEKFIAEYCSEHSQSCAEIEVGVSFLGKISKEDGSRYGVTD